MASAAPITDGSERTAGGSSVLTDLRELAITAPGLAQRHGWDYVRELGDSGRRNQLHFLFSQGAAPQRLDGALEGLIVGNLFGIPEAHLANPLLKIEPTWRGKSFDAESGTGYNRLALISRAVMPVIAPGYRGLRRLGSEWWGSTSTTASRPPPSHRSSRCVHSTTGSRNTAIPACVPSRSNAPATRSSNSCPASIWGAPC